MKKTGAWLVVHALEQIGVKYTFGIPGVHNTEIYDELNITEKIEPILVTHEAGAAFMADAVSRTGDSIGTLVIVPAAGSTHAMSGIGEAFLDGIPMLIISGGVRRDSNRQFQLHQMDLQYLLSGITKKTFLIEKHEQIVQTIYEAYNIAISGESGPVFVEIPVEIQLFQAEVANPAKYLRPTDNTTEMDLQVIEEAANILANAEHPGIFAGWGANNASTELIAISELLGAPVSTTLQGLSVFPAEHPLHTGMGFGKAAVPAATNAFKDCDALLAVATRFAEIPTGSFGIDPPKNLIHIDINPKVFNANYPAQITIEGDSAVVLKILLEKLKEKISESNNHGRREKVAAQIKSDKMAYFKEWADYDSGDKVNPGVFFAHLNDRLEDEDYIVVDDGNHTYLAAELAQLNKPRHFICPTDFNCMGYCVPASIGVKLDHRQDRVVGIVGDGAFIMTAMEMITATTNNLGIIYFVFHDGELSQISQGQEIPYNRKTCTILGQMDLQGVAHATGSFYMTMQNNSDIELVINDAFEMSDKGQPVIVDVHIDYSKRTRFTKGIVSTNLSRFPLGEKFRFIGRAMLRKITG